MTVVVCKNKWEHRILHEIIEGSSCQLVQLHQILKIGEFSKSPTGECEKEEEEEKKDE